MIPIPVNVTDFARGLSDFLNQVQYQGQILNIERGKKVIAKVSPASMAAGFPIGMLDQFLAKGPQLSSTDRSSLAKDVNDVRLKLSKSRDPWA
jgi:hypothetical protein